MLIRIAMKSESRMKISAIEGLARLIYNERLKDAAYFVSVLIIIWLEPVHNA